jgi:hypothetical protein
VSLGGGRTNPGQLGAGKKPVPGKLKKTPERVGTRFENELEKKLKGIGARKQPGSGNYVGKPADLSLDEPGTLLMELKEITGRRVDPVEITKWLRKITREARGSGRKPCLAISFPNLGGPVAKHWAMLPVDVLEKLILAAGWEGFDE